MHPSVTIVHFQTNCFGFYRQIESSIKYGLVNRYATTEFKYMGLIIKNVLHTSTIK